MCGPLSLTEWRPAQPPEILDRVWAGPPLQVSLDPMAELCAAPLLTRDWGSVDVSQRCPGPQRAAVRTGDTGAAPRSLSNSWTEPVLRPTAQGDAGPAREPASCRLCPAYHQTQPPRPPGMHPCCLRASTD